MEILIQFLLWITIIALVLDVSKRHFKQQQANFHKEFSYKKYGEVLSSVEDIMSNMTSTLKVYFGLLISRALINDSTPTNYVEFINGDIRRCTSLLNNLSLQLRSYKRRDFWLTPSEQERISECCKNIEQQLYRDSVASVIEDINVIDLEEATPDKLNDIHAKALEITMVQFSKYVDRAYRTYQDLCEELLK